MCFRELVISATFAVAVSMACSGPGPQSQSPGAPAGSRPSVAPAEAKWQSSWETFVDTINKCVEDAKCDTKQFAGKEVVWEGVIDSSDPAGTGIELDMGARRLQALVDGIPKQADIVGFSLKPESGQQDKWKGLAKGQRVRFRTTLGSQGRPGTATSWTFLGSRLIGFVESSGGELLEALPNK